jgi:hypothetical protein
MVFLRSFRAVSTQWLVCAFCLTTVGAEIDVGRPDQPRRITAIRDEFEHRRSIITSVEVTSYSTLSGMSSPRTWITQAASGECRYDRIWHGEANDYSGDPRAVSRYYDSKCLLAFRPFDLILERTKRKEFLQYADKLRLIPLWDCLGWWPPDDRSSPPTLLSKPFFHNAVVNDRNCRVRPAMEDVDGQSCEVLEIPNSVILWHDPKIMAVRKETVLETGGTSRKSTAVMTFECRDFRWIGGKVWLPFECRRSITTSPGYKTDHHVLEYKLNDVNDSFFIAPAPPGTLVVDQDSNTLEQIPGGLDHLSKVIGRAQRHLVPVGSVFSTAVHALAIVCATAVMFVIGLLIAKPICDGSHTDSPCLPDKSL